MATTSTWLTTYDWALFSFSLVSEGLDLAYCTTGNTAAMTTAWAGTPWASTTWRSGLGMVGEIGSEVELFEPSLRPGSAAFRIVDHDDNLAAVLARPLSTAGVKTYLAANADNNDTTLTVDSTTGFAASGTVYIGLESIAYTGVTATTFTGCTRGKYTLWQTNGGTDFARYHRIDPNPTGPRPVVSSYPRRHYNRTVWLYLHHWENGAWSTKANSLLVWSGRIGNVEDNGDGSLTVNTLNVLDQVKGTILAEQLRGDLAEGLYLSPSYSAVRIIENGAAAVEGTLGETGAMKTHADLSRLLQAFFDANAASLSYDWTVGTVAGDGRYRIKATHTSAPASSAWVRLYLHKRVWAMLGDDPASGDTDTLTIGGTAYVGMLVRYVLFSGTSPSAIIAPSWMPVVYYYDRGFVNSVLLTLNNAQGTWTTQPVLPLDAITDLPSTVHGFLQIGAEVAVAVSRASDTSYTIKKDISAYVGLESQPTDASLVVREGENVDPIKVVQLWYEADETRDVFLRMLLSTGLTSYNHATYDVNGFGMGVGVPSSMLKLSTFDMLGTARYSLFINKPSSVATLLESALAAKGLYLVWKDGQLWVRQGRYDGQNLAASWTLNNSNKARPDDRMRVAYGSDGLQNRLELKYQPDLKGEFRATETIEDVVSIADFGRRKTMTVDGYGIRRAEDVEAWRQAVTATALAYFSREQAVGERTFDFSLLGMVPVDTVLCTDPYMVDPRTGTRGVTSYPGWILGARFNFETGVGSVRIAFLPDLDYTRIGTWGPAARVDEAATNGGYVVATKVLTVKANAYSVSGGTKDVDRFAVGDLVRVREVSIAAGLTWDDTIATITSATPSMTLTTGLAGWNSTKQYLVENQEKTAVVAAQKTVTYVADDVTNSTGESTDDAYHYGGIPDVDFTAPAVSYTGRYYRQRTDIDDTAFPLTVADYYDLVQALNGLLAYGTRWMVSDFLQTGAAVTGTTRTRLWGPVWLPCMAANSRQIGVRIYGRHSTAARAGTFTIRTCTITPFGTSDTTVQYDTDSSETADTVTTTSTTDAWIAEKLITIYPAVADGAGPLGLWLTVEGTAGQAGDILTLAGISVLEGAL